MLAERACIERAGLEEVDTGFCRYDGDDCGATAAAEKRHPSGVGVGDRVEFVEVAPGRYEFIAATRSVKALKGMFGKTRKSVSIETMNAAIARRGAAARGRLG